MDTANEKKWFVYMEDHHEGPFSLADVQTKINEGTVRKDQYIWAEGMPDWKPMAEVSEFQFLFLPTTDSKAPAATPPFLTGEMMALAPNVDNQGLPGLEVPIQTMMEKSLEGGGPVGPPAATELVAGMEALGGADAGPTLLTEAVEPSIELGAPPTGATDQGPSLADQPHEDFTDAAVANNKKRKKEDSISLADRSRNLESLVSAKQEPSYGTQTREHVALVQQGPQVGGGTNRFKRFLKFILFVGFMGGLGYSYFQGYLDPVIQNPMVREQARKALDLAQPAVAFVVEKVPFLGQFLSPIPHLSDVSPQDYEDLRLAASAPLSSGPAAAVALASGDGRVVRFYVSSNLPDGAGLVVHMEGVPETLLNATEFTNKLPVSLAKRLGQTKNVVQADGSAIPKGEYNIYVYEADQQPEAVKAILDASKTSASDKLPRVLGLSKKVGSAKKYFLGGVRDRDYDERLKKYHLAVRERARLDYEELFQVYTTLVSQYNSSFTRMQDTRLKLNKAKASPAAHGKGAKAIYGSIQKKWTADSAGWVRMQNQLNKFGNWTPEFLKATIYPNVFNQMKRIGEAVSRYYEAQAAFFGNPLDPALETKVDEVQKQTQGLFYELGPKIKKIQESLAKPDGLPAKVD